jgi:hypothetical protein
VQFEVFKVRNAGVLIPRHVMWAGMVRGHLCVVERHDVELNRVTRVATIEQPDPHAVLLGPMFDAALVTARADWWTMTGWERVDEAGSSKARACMQSWVLIPATAADDDRLRAAHSNRRL